MCPVCAWAERLPLCAVIIVRVISFLRKWRLVRAVWELSRLYKATTTLADLTGAQETATFSTSSTTRPAVWTGLWRMRCARGYWTWAAGSWGSTRESATTWPTQHKQVGSCSEMCSQVHGSGNNALCMQGTLFKGLCRLSAGSGDAHALHMLGVITDHSGSHITAVHIERGLGCWLCGCFGRRRQLSAAPLETHEWNGRRTQARRCAALCTPSCARSGTGLQEQNVNGLEGSGVNPCSLNCGEHVSTDVLSFLNCRDRQTKDGGDSQPHPVPACLGAYTTVAQKLPGRKKLLAWFWF